MDVRGRLRLFRTPTDQFDVVRKKDLITGESVNYSLEPIDTGVRWVDGSPIWRRVFITTTTPWAGGEFPDTVVNIPNGYGFRGLIKLDGYAIVEHEEYGSFRLPINYWDRGSPWETFGAFHVFIDDEGRIYEGHSHEIMHERPLILIVDYLTSALGLSSWDNGATVWDGGTTSWDSVSGQMAQLARSTARRWRKTDGVSD